MITFRQHIDLMNHLRSGRSTEDFIDNLSEFDSVNFMSFFEDVYPIQDNTLRNKDLESEKNVYLSVNSLVLGQFIMLEQIITGKTKLPDHLVDLEIAKLIIRPCEDELFDNEDEDKELSNHNDVLDMDVRNVYYILNTYIEDRNKILFNDFSGVFYEPQDDTEEDNGSEDTSNMMFNQQWYWYSIVRLLSGEDIHKYEKTYMLSMRTVLPEMSFLAQRSKIEAAEQRRSEAMRKL
jgi:hypothetical protein